MKNWAEKPCTHLLCAVAQKKFIGEYDMKKVWKWVIGILVVLVIVAALVGGAFLLRSHFASEGIFTRQNRPGVQVPGNGKIPGNENGQGDRGGTRGFPGMMPYGDGGWGGYGMHRRGPAMMGFGWMMPFGGLFTGLICLGFLALVVLGMFWLVNRLRKPVAVATPVAPVAAEVAPVVTAVHSCSKCGEPVQEGWKHCPNCGKRQ
jgi:hypothetical protein